MDALPPESGAEARPAMDRLEDAYVRNAPAALRLAYFLTGNREQAEDLVQDAFARVAGRFRHRRAVDDLDAYLRRTVVNLFSSGLRRRKIERAWLERERNTRLARPVEDDPAVRDEMWEALQALPERQRAAVVLRFYRDLSERDVAAMLGISPGAVNSLVVRAMHNLRATLTRGEEQ
jgi:RNA polymerase sigma-70 factor (sigma-E family)